MNLKSITNRPSIVRLLESAVLATLLLAFLTGCNDADRQKWVGETVTLSNVVQTDPLTISGGWHATASAEGQSVNVHIEWRPSIQTLIVNGAQTTIVTVPATYEGGTASINGNQFTYYIR